MVPKSPMVVEYIKLTNEREMVSLKQVGVHFCCAEMSRRFKSGTIQFGQRSEETCYNTSIDVYIRVENGARVLYRVETPIKPNTDIPLAYCPFCSEPIMAMELTLGYSETK